MTGVGFLSFPHPTMAKLLPMYPRPLKRQGNFVALRSQPNNSFKADGYAAA
jgi:hypothetical protein